MRILAGLLLALLAAFFHFQEPAHVRKWEHESSDVPVDARMHFGHLDNGLRWAWVANATPAKRSYLRLHLDVGSLAEEDPQRGMAHFLEHMAFNGSEHFAPGTLVEWFQRHGMGFGRDLNAHTDFSSTVYELDLPEADEQSLDEGLTVLRDFASGLTLAPAEIEHEKGVIDGEERESDSPGYRLFVRTLQVLFGDTRYDERVPIGVRELRQHFTAEDLRAFYRKWYRPEHVTLILVGDLGTLDPHALFEKHFGDWARPAAPFVAAPKAGVEQHLAQRQCLYESELPGVQVQLGRLHPFVDEPYDAAHLRTFVPITVARRIVNLRFAELVKQKDAPFLSAGLDSARALDAVDGEELTLGCAPEKWKEALSVGEQELRRALEHGFQEAELREVRDNVLRAMDEAVERKSTQESKSLVSELLQASESRYVPTDPETDRALYQPLYAALTVEACQKALVAEWAKGELSLVALGNLDLGSEAAKTLDEALAASRAVAVAKGAEISQAAFAYTSQPEPLGEIVERRHVDDLDYDTLRFANGVALNVKRTDLKKKQILVHVLFGEGQLTLEPKDAAISWIGQRVYLLGGLEAHSFDDLRRIFAGKEVGLSFSSQEDAFALDGATTAEDLLLQFELACACLSAPGWREDGFVQFRRQLPLQLEAMRHQHNGPVATAFMGELYGGDARFTFPSAEALEAVQLANVRAWLAPLLLDAPIEVSVVGDLDVEEVVHAAARTFARLPARRELKRFDEHRQAPVPKAGVAQVHEIETEVPKSLVLITFPIADGIAFENLLRAGFLVQFVRDRLRVEVRERLGAAYDPTAGVQLSRVLANDGLLFVQAMAEPDAALTLKEACFAVTDALARDGVTKEEVERLRAPMLKGLRDARQQNGYWVGALAETHRRPQSLDEMRAQESFLMGLDAETMSALAKTYLVRARSSFVIVNPRAKEAAKDAAGDAAAPQPK